jgi:hypothetical protein
MRTRRLETRACPQVEMRTAEIDQTVEIRNTQILLAVMDRMYAQRSPDKPWPLWVPNISFQSRQANTSGASPHFVSSQREERQISFEIDVMDEAGLAIDKVRKATVSLSTRAPICSWSLFAYSSSTSSAPNDGVVASGPEGSRNRYPTQGSVRMYRG